MDDVDDCTHQRKPAEGNMSEFDIPALKYWLKVFQVRLAVVPHLHSTLRKSMHNM